MFLEIQWYSIMHSKNLHGATHHSRLSFAVYRDAQSHAYLLGSMLHTLRGCKMASLNLVLLPLGTVSCHAIPLWVKELHVAMHKCRSLVVCVLVAFHFFSDNSFYTA